ncbi:MAG: NAD(P)-dependent oxidoreductase [Saprospiraceae bacterium]|nr:NAD(P)-dependent oxidoreductase [Saprospiraceae bacterium]
MKRLLITGATGFIGGFLAEEAIRKGFHVIASVRKKSDLSYIKHLQLEYVELDLSSSASMVSILNEVKPDYIIHNAGLTKAASQAEYDVVNADYTNNLALASMQAEKIPAKFLYMSSLASYGPADFQSDDTVMEHHTPHPVTMYGRSKLKAENMLKSIPGLNYLIFRPTAVYGPREKDLFTVFKMVDKGIAVHTGKGDQKLTFIYVFDLIELMLRSLENNAVAKSYFVTDGKVYNTKDLNRIIGENLGKKTVKIGLPLTIISIVGLVSEWIGKLSGKIPSLNRDKLNEIKASNWQCNAEPLFEDTAYRPQVTLEDGLSRTVKWYRANKWI